MVKKAVLFAGLSALVGAMVPGAALAQSGDKDSAQIACELDDTCAGASPAAAEPAAAAPKTRSWSWGNRASSGSAPAAATTTARATARPAALAASSRTNTARTYGANSSRLAISFASGSDELTSAGRRQADELYKAISTRAKAGGRYLIAGHTDASGAHDLNLELSRRRAQVLVDYLVDKGIPRENFRARGYGYDRPLQGTAPSSSANRRVEVTKLN